jgi:hypothetical protein
MVKSKSINYRSETPPPLRVWGMTWGVWLLIAAFCGFAEFTGAFATGGRVNGRADVAFILIFALIGVAAVITALRLLLKRLP